MTLKEYLEERLAISKKLRFAFTDEQFTYLEGREAELEALLEAIAEGELNGCVEVSQ